MILPPNKRRNLRTKKEIISDFKKYLLKEKIIKEEEVFTDEELLTLLYDFLYEFEEIDGVMCSTPRAWFVWLNVVLKHEPTTKQPLWNDFVKNIFLDIERHRYTAILSSRGIGKSYVINVLYALFKMFLFENTNIVSVSNIPKMCKRNVRKAKQMIEHNELLLEKKADWKKRELIWSQEQFEYNEGLFETNSLGSNVRSAHVNFIFIDDLLRDDAKYSNEEIMNFFEGQLFPIAQRFKARMIVTGTPLSVKDLYHDIMNEKPNFQGKRIGNGRFSYRGFFCKEYRIIKDWDKKEILLPDLFSWWELADENNPQSLINVQGRDKFMREYMLVCTDESTTLFPESLLKKCSSDYKYLEFAEIPEKGEQPKDYIIGVDVATAGTASADFSAFVVLELIQTEVGLKKIVRHITKIKGLPITGSKDKEGNIIDIGQVETIENLSKGFNNAFTVVEKNNVGVAFIQELQKRNVNVDEFVTTKTSKENMIRFLISEMRSGNLLFAEDCPEIRDLKKELSNFGVKRTKTGKERMEALSGHDDTVLALAIANFAATNMTHTTYIGLENIY